jgi:hypothetical protein
MIVLKATHASASPDTLKDVIRLGDRGDDAPSLMNKILYLTLAADPANGQEARTSAFSSADRTLTFTPPAASVPQEADEAELWSVTQRIGAIDTLHRLFNAGIRAVQDVVATEVWADAAAFSARSPQITIPADWVEFGGADWIDPRGSYNEIPPDHDHLRVRPGLRTVELVGRASARANHRNVRLWGYTRAREMTADSGANGETNVDPEWLVEAVLSWVGVRGIANASESRGLSQERMGGFWAQQAAQYRRNVSTPRRGMGIPLL